MSGSVDRTTPALRRLAMVEQARCPVFAHAFHRSTVDRLVSEGAVIVRPYDGALLLATMTPAEVLAR